MRNAEKLTHHERELKKHGYDIIPFTHEEIVDHLMQIFERDREKLLLLALSDQTKRRKLCLVLDYDNIGDTRTNFGGTIFYDAIKRRFTYISYSDRHNWAVMFSIESRVAFFAREYYQQVKKLFPYGYSIKRLSEWLLKN